MGKAKGAAVVDDIRAEVDELKHELVQMASRHDLLAAEVASTGKMAEFLFKNFDPQPETKVAPARRLPHFCDTPEFSAEPVAAGPSMTVLDRIGGDGEESVRHSLKSAYGNLCAPLPLRGTVDAERLRRTLDAEWPWATEMTGQALEALEISAALGKRFFWLPPVLLDGPPGVGKTRWARRLAEEAGLPSRCIPLAANSDPFILVGMSRAWRASLPCVPAQFLAREKTANALICLDEVDKAGRSQEHGSVVDALLPLLERGSASRHYDACLEGQLDLRWLTWTLTSNDACLLPEPLLSRCRVLKFPEPRPQDFEVLLRSCLKEIASQWEADVADLPRLPAASVVLLEREFCRDRSVRALLARCQSAMSAAARGIPWALPTDGSFGVPKNALGFTV